MQLSASILLAGTNSALPVDLAASRSRDDSSDSASSTARDFGDLLNDQESNSTATPAPTQNPKSVASRKASATTYQSESDDSALETDADQDQPDASSSVAPSAAAAWMLANGLIGIQPPVGPAPLPLDLSGSITLDVSAADGTAENAEYSNVTAGGSELSSFASISGDQLRPSLPAGYPTGEVQSSGASDVTSGRQCAEVASSETSFSPDATFVSPLTTMVASAPTEGDDEVSLTTVESLVSRSSDPVSNQSTPAVSCYQQLTTRAQTFVPESLVDRPLSNVDYSVSASADLTKADTEGLSVEMDVAPTSIEGAAGSTGTRGVAAKLWDQLVTTGVAGDTANIETDSTSAGLAVSPQSADSGAAQLLNQDSTTDLTTAVAKTGTDRVSVKLQVSSSSAKANAGPTTQPSAAAKQREQLSTTRVAGEAATVETDGISAKIDVPQNLVEVVASSAQATDSTAKICDQLRAASLTTEIAKTGTDRLSADLQVAPKAGETAATSATAQQVAATALGGQVVETAVLAGTVAVDTVTKEEGAKVDPRSGKTSTNRTSTRFAVSQADDTSDLNQEGGANFAAITSRSVTAGISVGEAAIKKTKTTEYEDNTSSSITLGTNAAKALATMSAHAATAETSSTIDLAAALSATATDGAAVLTNDTPTAATSETAAAARSAVESVLAVADHFATTGGQHGVNLKFTVSGIDLAVRVEIRGDQLQTTFRTDSAELRSALENEWKAVASEASDRTQRVAAPVFTSSSGNDAFSSNSGGSDQRGSYAQQDETSFARLAAEARGTLRVAAAAPTAASSLSTSITEPETIAGRLHVLV